jgi:hypothetical protein
LLYARAGSALRTLADPKPSLNRGCLEQKFATRLDGQSCLPWFGTNPDGPVLPAASAQLVAASQLYSGICSNFAAF